MSYGSDLSEYNSNDWCSVVDTFMTAKSSFCAVFCHIRDVWLKLLHLNVLRRKTVCWRWLLKSLIQSTAWQFRGGQVNKGWAGLVQPYSQTITIQCLIRDREMEQFCNSCHFSQPEIFSIPLQALSGSYTSNVVFKLKLGWQSRSLALSCMTMDCDEQCTAVGWVCWYIYVLKSYTL